MSLVKPFRNAAACTGEYEVVKRLCGDQWKSVFFREGQVRSFDSLEAAFSEFISAVEQFNCFSILLENVSMIEFGILNLEINKIYEIAQKEEITGLILFDPETGTVMKEVELDWLLIRIKQSPPRWPQTF